jgi:hypothetical protein
MAQANRWDAPLGTTVHRDGHEAPILTPDEARQGVVSGRVRMILASSLTLVIIAFALVFAFQV